MVAQGLGSRAILACEVGDLAVTLTAYFWFRLCNSESNAIYGATLSLDIKTDRLLDSSATLSEAVLLIHVRTRLLMGNFANLGLI